MQKFKIKDIETYVKNSEATLSENFKMNSEISEELEQTICEFIEIGNKLDKLKKKIFYVKPNETENEITNNEKENLYVGLTLQQQKILHATLGIGTESVEIVEALHKSKKEKKELDYVNLGEEIADIMWYFAIFFRETNIKFYDILSNNLNKLFVRFGDKFDAFMAKNRKLDKERTELQNKINKIVSIQPRRSGKTTKAIYEFLKDPKNTLFVVHNNDAVKNILNISGEEKNVIPSEQFKNKLIEIKPKNIILDEYMFFKNRDEIWEEIQNIQPENVYIFSSSDKIYDKRLIDFVKKNKRSMSYNELLNKYMDEQKIPNYVYGSYQYIEKEIYTLYHNFLTDDDVIDVYFG